MKKINKTIYFLILENEHGSFQFHAWANSIDDAKQIAVEVYNNKNYNEELPRNRGEVTKEDFELKQIYNRETKSHVLSINGSGFKKIFDDKFDKIDSFLDSMSKAIEDFEDEEE